MCLFPKCLLSASAHALSRALQWLMDGANDALFNAAPDVQQAMAQNIAVTSHDISSTLKKIIKLKLNLFTINISKFIRRKRN